MKKLSFEIKSYFQNFKIFSKERLVYLIITFLTINLVFFMMLVLNHNYKTAEKLFDEFDENAVYIQVNDNNIENKVNSKVNYDINAIQNSIVTPYVVENGFYMKNNKIIYQYALKGTTSSFLHTYDIMNYYNRSLQYNSVNLQKNTLLKGRVWTKEEFQDEADVIILDEATALTIYQHTDVLGKKIFIGDVNYEIIGILNVQKDLSEKLISNKEEILNFYNFYLPYTTLLKRNGKLSVSYTTVRTTSPNEFRKTFYNNVLSKEQSEVLIKEDINQSLDVLLKIENENLLFLLYITVIVALAVIFLQIRSYFVKMKQEHAIRKALGAKDKDIFTLVFFENITLSALSIFLSLIFSLTIFIYYIFYSNTINYSTSNLYIDILALLSFCLILIGIVIFYVMINYYYYSKKNIINILKGE